MTAQKYRAAIQGIPWPFGAFFLVVVAAGTIGALYLTDRLAASSSWARENVFLAMLPTLLAPTIVATALLQIACQKLGLRCCSCGETLLPAHPVNSLREGTVCRFCGAPILDTKRNTEKET